MKISVVIPVRNEADSIRTLLDGLLDQSLLPNEILITDGGSNDGTTAILQAYTQQHATVRLFQRQMPCPARVEISQPLTLPMNGLPSSTPGLCPRAIGWLNWLNVRPATQILTLFSARGSR